MSLLRCTLVFAVLNLPLFWAELHLGSFNSENFTDKMLAQDKVIDVFVKIIRQFDMISLQEISTCRENIGGQFLDILNKGLSKDEEYLLAVSPALGRTSQTEQYGVYYKASKFHLTAAWVFSGRNMNRAYELFERPPFITQFTSSATKLDHFTLVNFHSKPTPNSNQPTNKEELLSLKLTLDSIKNDTNIMLLGDLNADCTVLTKTEQAEVANAWGINYKWLINETSNIQRNENSTKCAYDRFIASAKFAEAVDRNSVKVYHYYSDPKISTIMKKGNVAKLDVSDHLPIRMTIN